MLTCNIFLFFVLFITGFLVLAPVKKVIVCLSKVPRGFSQSSFLSSTIVAKERNHCALSTSLANHHFRYLNNPLLQPLGYRYWGTHKNYYYSFKIFSRFWLFITTRIIHHNRLRLCHIEPMTSKVLSYWPNDVKMTSKERPAAFKILIFCNKAIIEFGFRRIWRILPISEGFEGVTHHSLRPRWITPS